MIRNIYILTTFLFSLMSVGWGQDCPEGTVFVEEGNYMFPEGMCVPTEFSTVYQSSAYAFYYIFEVTINGAEVEADDWVGVFNGDVCVGARKWNTSLCNSGVCDVPVMGDNGSDYTTGYMLLDEIPTFKIYGASEDVYYNATPSEDMPWSNFAFNNIDALYADASIYGCTDSEACNYDETANADDGSCEYEFDCAGDCGGDAVIDMCDTCDDDPSNDCTQDCAGNWGGIAEVDECGVCGGDSSSCEIPGCMDETAYNYNPNAFIDDGSCLYTVYLSFGEYSITGYDSTGNGGYHCELYNTQAECMMYPECNWMVDPNGWGYCQEMYFPPPCFEANSQAECMMYPNCNWMVDPNGWGYCVDGDEWMDPCGECHNNCMPEDYQCHQDCEDYECDYLECAWCDCGPAYGSETECVASGCIWYDDCGGNYYYECFEDCSPADDFMNDSTFEDMCQFITESFDSGCLDDCDSVMFNELEIAFWYCNGWSEGYCSDPDDPNPANECDGYDDQMNCDTSQYCDWITDGLDYWCAEGDSTGYDDGYWDGDGCGEYNDEISCEGGEWSYCSATTATSPGECDDINADLAGPALEECWWVPNDDYNYLIGHCECTNFGGSCEDICEGCEEVTFTEPTNECQWYNSAYISGCLSSDENICDYLGSQGECLNNNCQWNYDENGGYCHQDDGPPECVQDCEGIDEIDDDNATELCIWITNLPQGDMGPACAEDCDEEEDDTGEFGGFNCLNYMCGYCLADNSCDFMANGPGDDGDSLGYSANFDKIQSVLEFLSNVKDIREQEAAEYRSGSNDGRSNNPIYSVDILIENPNSNLRGFQFTINDYPKDFLHLYDVGGGIAEEAGFETGFNPNNGIVVGYDIEGGSITDTLGILTTIDLTGYIGIESIEICMTDAILTGPTGWDLYEAETGSCITIENQLGDINYDGQINVLDVVIVVDLTLQYYMPDEYEQWAADMNADGSINVQDIVILVDVILGVSARSHNLSLEAAELNVFTDKITISSDGIIAGVELHTLGDYTITGSALSEGWEYYNNNNIILIVDMAGTGISEDMTLYYDGTMQIKNSLLSDWSGNGISASLNIIPDTYILESAYPNPFNPTTTLSFALPMQSDVTISIYNLQGREVASLVNGNMDAGYHSVVWNADAYSSGVYFVKMVSGEYVNTQKLMLVK